MKQALNKTKQVDKKKLESQKFRPIIVNVIKKT